MRYIILANGQHAGFKEPRQLSKINGERLLDRTIRLLRENGIKDIAVTGNYTDINAKVLNIKSNYNYDTNEGYWLDAFTGLLEKPTCFLFGDVYFSEQAIKTIVESETESTLFYCSYNNKNIDYIKEHDEPFGYKVINTQLFKNHIEKVERLYDEGKTIRNPIIWEVYRSINGININKHRLGNNVIIINDITCDIDFIKDIKKIELRLGGYMVRVRVKEGFNLCEEKWNQLQDIIRGSAENIEKNKLYVGDTFLCSKELAEYFLGANGYNKPFVEVLEVIPEKAEKKPVKRGKKSVK